MRCRNCGADYRTRELKCPYCGAENLLGRIWMGEVSDAERKYEKARKEARKGLPVYVMNRVVNRVLVLLTIIFFGAMIIYGIVDNGAGLKAIFHTEQTKAQMKEYYDAGEWVQLYHYMSDYSLFSQEEDSYVYSQAAFAGIGYQQFCDHKYEFCELTDEEKMEDDYHLEQTIRNGWELMTLDYGIYDEGREEVVSSPVYQDWCADVRSFWMGTLGMTADEVEEILNIDYISGSDLDPIIAALKARQFRAQEVASDAE